MSDIAIKVENLSKVYRLGEIGTGTLSRDLERWWRMSVLGQEDPFLKIGRTNDRTKKGDTDVVYSLRDIDFEIKQGDAVGIVGKNGAGKSTLLKILSRVTTPSAGRIHIKGRVASLLEVGTGFHPELTGRENIFLNGAILGMRRYEIAQKLDEIIDFSGVERYIDTPVKRYSSGMYVRLAFSVTAFLESEIFVVDEVLAVGDAEFQKRCLTKMDEVGKQEGRTVLFVSHNMQSVKSLCTKGILLANGTLINSSNIDEIVNDYQSITRSSISNYVSFNPTENSFKIIEIGIRNSRANYSESIVRNNEICVDITYENNTIFNGIYFNIKIKNTNGEIFLVTTSSESDYNPSRGLNSVKMVIPKGFFNKGIFQMDISVMNFEFSTYTKLFEYKDALTFEVHEIRQQIGGWSGKESGFVRQPFEWIEYSSTK